MPYIRLVTTAEISPAQQQQLKSGLAHATELIPGKTEAKLMLELDGGKVMFFQGEQRPLAYVDAKFSGPTDFADRARFTEAVFALCAEVLAIPADSVYLTYTRFDEWGTGGTLKGR